jgi:hypothetical protein
MAPSNWLIWLKCQPGRGPPEKWRGGQLNCQPVRPAEAVVMSTGETAAHRQLKALALRWALAQGHTAAATEVRLPRSGFRVDVAAYTRAPRGGPARTAVFECKQARADLLKDAHAEAETRRRLDELVARRAKLETLLGEHRPDLRRGETLFPEFAAFDFTGLRHDTYHAVLAEIAACQRHLLGGVKFARMLRYAAADALYLVAEDGIFTEAEIPAGWGLLVRRGEALELVRKPLRLDPPPAARTALLECIAQAATRAVVRTEAPAERRDLAAGTDHSHPAPEFVARPPQFDT